MTDTEVFLLAQQKGYHIRDLLCLEKANSSISYFNDRLNEIKYIELCLLQRWFRNIHKIDITIMLRFADTYSVFIHKNRQSIFDGDLVTEVVYENVNYLYETTLIKGLEEAFKLI